MWQYLEKKGVSFVILEAASKCAKKILATGNGKCNLTNLDVSKKWYNTPFVEDIVTKYTPQVIVEYFEELGVKTKVMEARVYPYSESSNTVADMLIDKIEENIICNFKVKSITKKDLFVINGDIRGKNVFFATGSNATLGYDSNHLLADFGHKSKEFSPSLVWLITETKYIKKLSGLRSKCKARLYDQDKLVAEEEGEVLFKDNGLSGIAIFMLSSYIARKNGNYKISLDLAPELTAEEIKNYPVSGIVKKQIGENVAKQAEDYNQSIESTLKNFQIKVKTLADVKYAQVCSGGLFTKDFDKKTLQSKLVKGLYVGGEALDVDGQCGGYNLHWAWASGMAVAESLTAK